MGQGTRLKHFARILPPKRRRVLVIVSTSRATLLGLAGIEVIGASGEKLGVITLRRGRKPAGGNSFTIRPT
jgi:hypothetical protein